MLGGNATAVNQRRSIASAGEKFLARHGELERRVAQARDLAGAKNIVGAPSFAHFAKGGNLEHMRDRVAQPQNLCRQHRTRPCKKRKDGAPSAPMAHTDIIKGWAHPPSIRNFKGHCCNQRITPTTKTKHTIAV